jgi:aquaporin rerated protein, other eukaryote
MFLFFGMGAAHIANLPGATNDATPSVNVEKLLFIAFAFGLSLVVNVWLFCRISGAIFNPAISLALALINVITPLRAAMVSIAQILGGMTAAALVKALTPGTLAVNTRLGGGVSISRGEPT